MSGTSPRSHARKDTAFTSIPRAAPHSTNVYPSTCGIFSVPRVGTFRGASASSPNNCTNSSTSPDLKTKVGGTEDTIARHRSISRITLRRILLAGLEDEVQFNKRFLRYEETPDGAIRAHFEDGSSAQADLLVAADGVNSGVRKQYLPHAEPIDTGVVGIGGTIPLTDGVMALAPHLLLDGPVMVVPPTACSMFMAMWKRSGEAGETLRRLGIEGPLPGDEDYLDPGTRGAAGFLRSG